MDIAGWDERYRSGARASEDLDAAPTPLVLETARTLRPGRALDLACGSGRNAILLAEHGWEVTAVDASSAAIEIVRARAEDRKLPITGVIADLTAHQFAIEENAWDLILIAYYLQRNLIDVVKIGVEAGGVLIIIVHITQGEEEPNQHRLKPGELRNSFHGWTVLHDYEGPPRDDAHRRAVAEIIAQKPPIHSLE